MGLGRFEPQPCKLFLLDIELLQFEADVHENICYFYSKIEDVETLCSRLYIKELNLPFRFEEILIGCLLGVRHCILSCSIINRVVPNFIVDIIAGKPHGP